MNCAALHKALGTKISIIKSMSMDRWSENELRLVILGGNQRLAEYFHKYDLNKVLV